MRQTATKRTGRRARGESKPHRIPVIEKMVEILNLMEGQPDGLTISEILAATDQPRSTVYRILNTLRAHGYIAPGNSNANYRLGARLVSLAQQVRIDESENSLVETAQPIMEKLAVDTNETCKLSIVDGTSVRVLYVELSPSGIAPTSRVGTILPMHAGASSKVLLAWASPQVLDTLLAGGLSAYTKQTMIESGQLRSELEAIRGQGIAYDRGEWNENIHAIAVPVRDHRGLVIASMSVVFFSSLPPEERETCEAALLAAADRLNRMLGWAGAEVARQAG